MGQVGSKWKWMPAKETHHTIRVVVRTRMKEEDFVNSMLFLALRYVAVLTPACL